MIQAFFSAAAKKASHISGSAWFFAISVAVIAIWMASGPYMGFNEAWNFWANTTTTLGTWILVILIQNSQNRSELAIQAKLDELIRVNAKARNAMLGLEDKSEEEIDRIRERFSASGDHIS
jgi:low affinity Fe/Cu permease